MKRYVSIGVCILFLFALLTACNADSGGKPSDSGQTPEVQDSGPAPDVAETQDSETVPDSVEVPDSEQEPDSVTVPNSAEVPDSPKAPDSVETQDSEKVPDSTPIPDSEPEARDLTETELQKWTKFLCKADCNGFLMSNYDTPLEADLVFVFYSGAGVGEYPSEDMVQEYLDANDLDEAYTDIVFIPYDEASKVLERRTGYTLEHFKLAGNDIPMYYSEKYAGYFHMAGDTNYMPVECVSGRLNADGSISLEVRESSDWNEDSACSFETTLKPDFNGKPGNMVFDKNVITGGWLMWEESEAED